MSTTASAIATATANSIGATKSKNATIRSYAKGLDSERAFTQQADINDSYQNQINTLRRSLNSLATAAGTTVTDSPTFFQLFL